MFSHSKNMANFEAFCWNISSSINLLFLKSDGLWVEKSQGKEIDPKNIVFFSNKKKHFCALYKSYGDPPPPACAPPVSLNCPPTTKLDDVTASTADFRLPISGCCCGSGSGGCCPCCCCCCCACWDWEFCEFGSYFLGLPRDKWRLFINSASSTIQNDPKSSSYLTKHLCNDKLVRIAFYELIVYCSRMMIV